MSDPSQNMKAAWNSRAQKDAFLYVETEFWNQDKQAFFALGEARAAILIDPVLKQYEIDPSGKVAVDIGCGVGRFTQALGRRFARAVGLDVSDGMVAQAQAAATGLSNLTFIAGDGLSLPQPSDSADFVWSYEVFQHMPSHAVIQANVNEAGRILKSSGHGLLHFRSAHNYPTIFWSIANLVPTSVIRVTKRLLGKDPLTADPTWRGAEPLTEANIEAMCRTAGLEVVEFREDPTHHAGSRVFAVVRTSRP